MGDYEPVPNVEKHGEFLNKVVDLLFKHVVFSTKQDKVLLWQNPEELQQLFDFRLNQNGESQTELINYLRNTIKFSVKTGHPYFINQLFSGLDPYGLAGQWLTDALNASVYTYEVAPVFTLMEKQIIGEICRMIGPQWGDGLFCPGGSFGNGTAIHLARYDRFPEIKEKGTYHLPMLVIFVSKECHYSNYKFAAFLGIGEQNVIEISTDETGQMIPHELNEKIYEQIDAGAVPLMVVATLGTTVRGAFDPITEISDICKMHNIWLHIDAAWGGGLVFSQTHRAKLNGIERANSIVINPHKLLAVPQQCSMLLVRNKDILQKCFFRGAEYLFQKDKHYDKSYDVGDKYVQCGRKCDVFKFWFMWKAKGTSGFAKHVEKLMELSQYFEDQVISRPEFTLVSKRHYMNVCFWFLPKYLRGKSNLSEHYTQLHKVAPQIRSVMIRHGSVMLGYQPLNNLPNFFRFVSQNSALTEKDIDFILSHISEIGDNLFP